MSRYLRFLGLFLILQGAVLAALFAVDRPHDSYLAASVDKARLLATAPSPRVVLVGGSNLAYGIDSRRIAAGLGGRYAPVNMGLHAGLGTRLQLDEALRGLKRGDLVVLSFEYQKLWDDSLESQTLLPLLAYRPSAIRDVPLESWPSLLVRSPDDGLGPLAHDMAQSLYAKLRLATTDRLRAAMRRLAGRGSSEAKRSAYTRGGFNRFGDQTSGWGAPTQYSQGVLRPEARPFPVAGLRQSVTAIQRFVAACHASDVGVVYDYPPIPEKWYQVNRPEIERTARVLESEVPIPFLNSPADNVYRTEDFFNTMYHLGGHAVQIRTGKLVRGLQRVLGERVPTP